VRDLKDHLGQQVTVKGRTGFIKEEKPGLLVFTFRDDYGSEVDVRSSLDERPIMGATYLITGLPNEDPATGRLSLQEQSRQRAYPTGGAPKWLLPAVAALVLLGVLAVVIIVRRRGAAGALPPAWGYLEVTSGPHQGKTLALRGDEVSVGRGLDPTFALDLPLDVSVSRQHGRFLREGDTVYYEDLGSAYGSRVDEQPAPAHQRVALPPGALVGLGSQTVVRVGPAGAAAAGATQFAGSPQQGGNGDERPTRRAPGQEGQE
jgi:hypothetical protein